MSLETKFTGMQLYVSNERNLSIEVDLGELHGETSTGKSYIVANTSGWKPFNTSTGVYKINCLIIKMKE